MGKRKTGLEGKATSSAAASPVMDRVFSEDAPPGGTASNQKKSSSSSSSSAAGAKAGAPPPGSGTRGRSKTNHQKETEARTPAMKKTASSSGTPAHQTPAMKIASTAKVDNKENKVASKKELSKDNIKDTGAAPHAPGKAKAKNKSKMGKKNSIKVTWNDDEHEIADKPLETPKRVLTPGDRQRTANHRKAVLREASVSKIICRDYFES